MTSDSHLVTVSHFCFLHTQTFLKLFMFPVLTFLCVLSPFLMGFGPETTPAKVTCYLHRVKCKGHFSVHFFLDLSVRWQVLFLETFSSHGYSDGRMAPSLVFSHLTDFSFSISCADISSLVSPLLVVSLGLSPGPFSLFYSPPKWSINSHDSPFTRMPIAFFCIWESLTPSTRFLMPVSEWVADLQRTLFPLTTTITIVTG